MNKFYKTLLLPLQSPNKSAKIFLVSLLLLFASAKANAAFTISVPATAVSGANFTATTSGLPSGTTEVDFYDNNTGTYLGSAFTSSATLSLTTTGNHTIIAYAFNSRSGFLAQATNSPVINITAAVSTAPTVTNGSVCTSGTVTLKASSTPAGGTYKWYSAATGGTLLQSSTTSPQTFTTPVLTTTTQYWVSYTSGASPESSRTLVTATVNTAPAIGQVSTTGLSVSYPFTGNSNDASGSGNNAAGNASLTTDRYGNGSSAYSFDGSTQYLASTVVTPSPGPQNFSISMWFKTSTAGGKLIGFGGSPSGVSGTYDRHIYMSSTGQIYFGIFPGTTQVLNTTAGYADGSWHHVVATVSTTTGSNLYVDGALQDTDPTMTTSQTYAGYWRIGYDNLDAWPSASNRFFNGSLDDIAIYSSSLTAAQVYALYGAGSTPVCSGSTLALQANTVTGSTYAWTGPNSFTSSAQNPTIANATSANAGTYVLTVTNSSTGCSSVINVTGVVNAPPVSTFTAQNPVIVNNNATITYTGTYDPASTYVWNFNGGTVVSGSLAGPYSIQWSTAGIKTVTLTVTNSSNCSSTSTQTVTVNGILGSYGFSKPITLNIGAAGLSTGASLANFPALVYIKDPQLITGNVCGDKVQYPLGNAGGLTNGTNYDFAFTLAGSTGELNYQVDTYDAAQGILLCWVQIPTVTAANTPLTFYFGSPNPTHTAAFSQATWAADYMAVYHFSEASASATVLDATSNGRNATQTNTTISNDEIHVAASIPVVGGGYSFNGTSSKIIQTAGTNPDITGTFTLSAWVLYNGTALSDNKIISDELNYGHGYKMSVKTGLIETETRTSTNPVPGNLLDAGTVSSGSWTYIQGVYDGTKFVNYVNGVAATTTNAGAAPQAGNVISLGVDYLSTTSATNFYNGFMDEVRISKLAKSPDWILCEYYNQTHPTTFTDFSGSITAYQSNASSVTGALTYTWTGATSTDPTLAGNWDVGQTPVFNGKTSLTINSSSNIPTLTADESIYELTINSGGSLNLNGHTLTVGCNIYNNATTAGTGILNAGNVANSGITWGGTLAAQSYNGPNVTNTAEIGNMTVNNTNAGTITIKGGPVDIYNQLTITKGNLVVSASPAVLTLVSTSSLTANVMPITSPYTIQGTVNVQRFITGNNSLNYRGYRLLSSAVNYTNYVSSTTGKNFYGLSTINQPYTAAGSTKYGVFTGGSGGGFSVSNPNPTIYLYKEPNSTQNTSFLVGKNVGVKSISGNALTMIDGTSFDGSTTGIPAGNGYLIYFLGSSNPSVRTTGTTSIWPDDATITHVGFLNQGDITVNLWYTPTGGAMHLSYTVPPPASTPDKYRGYNMIGNPYASTIDLKKVYADNSDATTGIGQVIYELYNAYPSNNYIGYNGFTGASSGSPLSGSSQFVASGQGFLVTANSPSSVLKFKETHKPATVTAPSPSILSSYPMQNSLAAQPLSNALTGLHLKMQLDSITFDECGIYFSKDWGDEYDAFDGKDLDGAGSSVFLSSYTTDNIRTCINSLGDYTKGKRVKLYVNGNTDGNYNLKLEDVANIDTSLFNIFLIDHMNKDSLDIGRYKNYAFTITKADTNSHGGNRLELAIELRKMPAYSLVSFNAQKASKGVLVTWKTNNAGNYTGYVLQKVDGSSFKPLYTKQSDGSTTYTYLDPNPITGNNIYRLQQNDIAGAISYSSTITIIYSPAGDGGALSVYPNPAKATININMATQTSATPKYKAVIYNAVGHLMMQKSVSSNSWTEDVTQYTPGTYIIQLTDENGNQVGKSKFVKTN
jgi:hypothetical protein